MARRRETNVDGAQRRVFDLLSFLGVRTQGVLLRSSLNWWYRRPDPWHAASDDYDRARYAMTLALIPDRPYRRILDVGCGEGLFTQQLAARHPSAEVVGVDISQRAIARAEATAGGSPQTRFKALDILNTAPGGSFDLIFCAETLYYLGRDARVRAAANRLLALLEPGGVLVLSHPWPQAQRLHRPFDSKLKRLSEHTAEGFRPYAVAVYERSP